MLFLLPGEKTKRSDRLAASLGILFVLENADKFIRRRLSLAKRKTAKKAKKSRLYLGVDVGGTKIQASLVEESGKILGRQRTTTPRNEDPELVVAAIVQTAETVLQQTAHTIDELTAVGVAVPGVVDPDAGRVIVTPNMKLGGLDLTARLENHFRVPVALGNDCNLGALGEAWLGSARNAESALVVLVGTGIGAGFVRKGKVWRGAREAAGEIGHIVMQIGGPPCGCGNHGCLEALASRSAIERDLRAAVAAGRPTVLTELLGGDLSLIRSSALRKALESGDELVAEVVDRASEVLGYACLTVRHLIDPDAIVLGGGVIEACGAHMVPIVERIIAADKLPGASEGGDIRLSALGDDAVVLGCVAAACKLVGRNPFRKRFQVKIKYPKLSIGRTGLLTVDGEGFGCDIFIRSDGCVKRRKLGKIQTLYGNTLMVGPEELERICGGGVEELFLGTGPTERLTLTENAQRYLDRRSIAVRSVPTAELPAAYNASKRRKAALIHMGDAAAGPNQVNP
jgi:glucokinase